MWVMSVLNWEWENKEWGIEKRRCISWLNLANWTSDAVALVAYFLPATLLADQMSGRSKSN